MTSRRSERPEHVSLLMQRVADGQASDQDLEEFGSLLEEDPGLADALEELQTCSSLFKTELLSAAQGVDFRGMQAKVLQQVTAPRPLSMWERVREELADSWRQHRMLLFPAGAALVAAGMALLVPALTRDPTSVPPGLTASRATEIHSLDTEDTTAVVFQTPASGLTVIWLAGNDEQEELDEEEAAVDEFSEMPEEVATEVADELETATP